jgi:hypothetical protein
MNRVKILASTAIALIAVTIPAWSDETLNLIASIGLSGPLTAFDISYVNILQSKYYLAHRDASALAIIDIDTNKVRHSDQNNLFTTGPNGVWTVNESQVWAGDGQGLVRIFDANGNVFQPSTGIPSSVSTLGNGRVDEGCFDPADQLVIATNNQEKEGAGHLFISFIPTSGPKAYTAVKRITLDGSPLDNTVYATSGIEQCVWSPFTGKIYQDVPEVNGTGAGAVMVIDPKTMTVEKNFPIPTSACVSPMGIAVGPPNQLVLGCNQTGPGSAVIDAVSGKVIKTLVGLQGTDEIWFNWRDFHYIMPHCTAECRIPVPPPTSLAPQEIALVDALSLTKDNPSVTVSKIISPVSNPKGNMRRVKSVASDPISNKIFIPIPAPGGPAPVYSPTFCSMAPKKINNPSDMAGCVAVFTTNQF